MAWHDACQFATGLGSQIFNPSLCSKAIIKSISSRKPPSNAVLQRLSWEMAGLKVGRAKQHLEVSERVIHLDPPRICGHSGPFFVICRGSSIDHGNHEMAVSMSEELLKATLRHGGQNNSKLANHV